MSAPEQASLPPFFVLTKGVTVRFTALDATDGSPVSGVVISGMRISVDQEDTDLTTPPATAPQPISLVPGSQT